MVTYKDNAQITNDELKAVAELHLSGLPASFLSSLGNRFLYLLYKTIQQSPSGILIIAKDEHRTVGFVSGTVNLTNIYQSFIKRYFWLIPFLLLKQLNSLQVFNKIKDLFLYPFSQKTKTVDVDLPSAELLSISVASDYQGKKIAPELYTRLTTHFRNLHITEFKIIVGSELLRAQAFYNKMTAEKIKTIELHKGATSWIYLQKVSIVDL